MISAILLTLCLPAGAFGICAGANNPHNEFAGPALGFALVAAGIGLLLNEYGV